MSGRGAKTRPFRRDLFLKELAKGLTVKEACQAAGLGRSTAYGLRAQDEEFAERWAEAYEDGSDVLEAAARRRAVEGVARITYDRDGGVRSEERVYSDRLLELLLKARRPDTYRERSEVRQVEVPHQLTPERLERNRALGMDDEYVAAAETMARKLAEYEGLRGESRCDRHAPHRPACARGMPRCDGSRLDRRGRRFSGRP